MGVTWIGTKDAHASQTGMGCTHIIVINGDTLYCNKEAGHEKANHGITAMHFSQEHGVVWGINDGDIIIQAYGRT